MSRHARVIAAVVAAVTFGVGCGGSSGQKVVIDATPTAIRHAAQATLARGTSKVDMTITMTIRGRQVSMAGTGAMDPANKRFEMSLDAKELFASVGGAKLPSSFDQPIDVIADHAVMYLHFAALATVAGGGKEWIKIDLGAVNKDLGDLIGGGGAGFGSDPTAFLQFLQGAGKVTRTGDEDIRGVHTTHFSGSYTLDDALAALPEDQRDRLQRAFTSLGVPLDAANQSIPFDAWIDDAGLVRRIDTSVDPSKLAPAGKASPTGPVSTRMEFFNFGSPVDIRVPSDDEVQDFSALAANAASKFSSVSSNIDN